MTRFYALLLTLLLLTACDPGPAQKCDYCRAIRNGVQRYLCDKCTKPHAACDSERSILHYSEGTSIRGRASYSATSILTCPAQADDASSQGPESVAVSVAEGPPPAPAALPFLPKLTFWQQAMAAALVIGMFFVGYGRGRVDRGRRVEFGNQLGNKPGNNKGMP